ncbi:hypothetical protein C0991_004236 [Blastosporella zonata]|nr:hypothetical protein C0991_004236 [Blastosporella zonata]
MSSRYHQAEKSRPLEPIPTAGATRPLPHFNDPAGTPTNGPSIQSTDTKTNQPLRYVDIPPGLTAGAQANTNFEDASSKHLRAEPPTPSRYPEHRLPNHVFAHDTRIQRQQASTMTHPAPNLDVPMLDKKEAFTEKSFRTLPSTHHVILQDNNTAPDRGDPKEALSSREDPSRHYSASPIQNPRLAELLSIPPLIQVVPSTASNDQPNEPLATSRHHQTTARPSPEVVTEYTLQSVPLLPPKARYSPEKLSREVDYRAHVTPNSVPHQSHTSRPFVPPSAPTNTQETVDAHPQRSHIETPAPSFPSALLGSHQQDHTQVPTDLRNHESNEISHRQTTIKGVSSTRIETPAQVLPYTVHRSHQHAQTQLSTASRNHEYHEASQRQATTLGGPSTHIETLAPVFSSTLHGSHQQAQTPHTASRDYEHAKTSYRRGNSGQGSSTHPLQTINDLPADINHTHAPVSSQRASRKKDHTKVLHKNTPVTQNSSATAQSSSVAYADPTLTVPAIQSLNHQQPYGSSTQTPNYKSSHKLPAPVTSTLTHAVPSSSNTSRPHEGTTQRSEHTRTRGPTTGSIDNPSTSQVDLTNARHVLPASQISHSRQQPIVSMPSHNVPLLIDPASISRTHLTSTRANVVAHPSESRTAPGPSNSQSMAPSSQRRVTVTTNVSESRPDTNHPQFISNYPSLPDPLPSKLSREVPRKPSEDSILLRTPSSLAPTVLKPTESRTSIPASFSSQTSSRRRGLFGMFRSKPAQLPTQADEPPDPTPERRSRKETRTSPQDNKGISLRTNPIPLVSGRKSPNKVFTPFRYLSTKRNRRVSAASLEAQDGTAPNTVIGSPTASMHSSQPPPMQSPPLRDVFVATQEWRHTEAAEVREVTGGKLRRARPGVVFDVAEDHTEEKRRKIKPQNRQSNESISR